MAVPREARVECDQISDWLEEQFGITRNDYIMRDVYSTQKHGGTNFHYSYCVLDQMKDEHIVMLKVALPHYETYLRKRGK